MSAKEIQNTIIFQHLVKKEFDRAELMCQEVLGTFLAQRVGMTSQKMVTDSSSLMMEKVSGVTLTSLCDQIGEELSKMVIDKLVEKLVRVKKKYLLSAVEIKCLLGQFDFKSLVEKNKNILIKYFGELVISEISSMSQDKFTICHGDLNLSNIMLTGSDLVLVDFEHVVEAPIEFDLACSVFFSDSKSLNVDLVVEKLGAGGIKISENDLKLMVKLYFADQMRKASFEKQQLLIEIAKNKKII